MLRAMSDRAKKLASALPPDLAADMEAQRLHTLLEVAFLAAASDGELADAEIQTLAANLQEWLGEELKPAFLVELFDHLTDQLAAEGATARLAAAAKSLDQESRAIAYKLACITALCDMQVHDEELGFLGEIAGAFEIPLDEAQATFDALDELVTGNK